MGQAKKVIFIGSCFACWLNVKIRFKKKTDGEGVGSTVTAGLIPRENQETQLMFLFW